MFKRMEMLSDQFFKTILQKIGGDCGTVVEHPTPECEIEGSNPASKCHSILCLCTCQNMVVFLHISVLYYKHIMIVTLQSSLVMPEL